jgi:predicted AlkP superfamily pyrophosphatase or phosphodiesterase
VSQLAFEAGVASFTVGPEEYSKTGFTQLTMSSATYVPARTFEDRTRAVRSILASKQKSLTYLYYPELDSIAHSHGVGSYEWLAKIEDLDGEIKKLVTELPSDTAVLLTADHGIVDVPREEQIYLDEYSIYGLIAVTGDPRNTFLYFEPEVNLAATTLELQNLLPDSIHVFSVEDLVRLGWLDREVANPEFLPDLFLVSSGKHACYHRGFCKPQSLRMIGQHGGISTTELSVPLLRFGCFA